MTVIQNLNSKIFISLFILFSITWFSCNDVSEVGSDLIGQDGFEVVYNDTASINTLTIEGKDSLQTNGENVITTDLFVGELMDPLFGFKKFNAYFQAGIGSVPPKFYDYDNAQFATIDSVVLIIKSDTSFFYGDREARHDIQVFQIEQDLDNDTELYTFDELSTKMTPISPVQSVRPSFENHIEFFKTDSSETGPTLRLKLDNSFGQMIINDTTAVKKDTSFLKLVNGMKIVSSPENSSVIALDLATTQLSDLANKMLVYYTDTIAKVYSFNFGGVRHQEEVGDITGSALEMAIGDPIFSDSLCFVQGFGTADTEIELPYARFEHYGNVLIKKAVLEVTIADVAGDDLEIFTPISLVGIEETNDDGVNILIIDGISAEFAGSFTTFFGGSVKEELNDNGEVIRKYYTFNITSHFINMISSGSDKSTKLYMSALVDNLTPGRSILYGPGHSVYPMKLNVTYTIPN